LLPFRDVWGKAVEDQLQALKQQIDRAVAGVDIEVSPEVVRGVPSQSLADLSAEVDLIVIGSRRWGAAARLLLGGTGEALARTSQAPLMLVPAPVAE
jgi:nucleotide-binding universal stress UspA family protein